jgi:hypothetical protein
MRYAIFSDIQGNRQALEAVLADMDGLQVDILVCLGDVAGYGPSAKEALQRVRSRTGNIVMGDCDAAAAGLIEPTVVDQAMRTGIKWNSKRLDSDSREYISKLPGSFQTENLAFTHAEIVKPSRFNPIDGVEVARANFASSNHKVTFVGHGFKPVVFGLDEGGKVTQFDTEDFQLVGSRRYIVNVGSVGEPLSAQDIRARYVVFDSDAESLFFRAVPFDPVAYRSELEEAGLPLRPWLPSEAEERKRDAVAGAQDAVCRMRSAEGVISAPPSRAPAHDSQPGEAGGQGKVALVVALLLLPLIAGAVSAFFGFNPLSRATEESPPEEATSGSVLDSGALTPAPIDRSQDAGTAAKIETTPAVENPEPASVPDAPEPAPPPTEVAEVPEPVPTPHAPEPKPEPKPPSPPAGLPPIPPAPANAAAATPHAVGLVFYAPLDEERSDSTVHDLVGGRDLDAAGGLPGGFGQVGLACQLERENGSEAMISEAKPMLEMKAITISFWIKLPPPESDDLEEPAKPGEKKAAPINPPMILVGLKDYCEVKLESNQIVANFDREGEVAKLAFPIDHRWHHVLVENGEGKTTIWIDHRSQSIPITEALSGAPSGVVQIGNKGAHFHIDELAIWNRKFTADERQILYRDGRFDTAILTAPKVIAAWGFDEKAGSRLFVDAAGRHDLGALKSWTQVKAIAPSPVPLTLKSNQMAAQIWKVSERPEDAGSFQLKADAAFTYEGWVKLRAGSVAILGGVAPAAKLEEGAGWRLEVRPRNNAKGDLSFIYEGHSAKTQAIGKEVSIYDDSPHHFAAVWNPLSTPTHGTMELYLDNKMVGSASLLRSELGPASNYPFYIVAKGTPIVLDELRFTSGALKSAEFLTIGRDSQTPTPGDPNVASDTDDGSPKEESIMQRGAREAQERKKKAKEERKARMEEEENRRKRGKLGGK